MRATPIAKAVSLELEPLFERLNIAVMREVNSQISSVLVRLEKDALTLENAMHDLATKSTQQHHVILDHVLELGQKVVRLTSTVQSHSAQIRALGKRQRATDKKVAALAKQMKAKTAKRRRRAAKSR